MAELGGAAGREKPKPKPKPKPTSLSLVVRCPRDLTRHVGLEPQDAAVWIEFMAQSAETPVGSVEPSAAAIAEALYCPVDAIEESFRRLWGAGFCLDPSISEKVVTPCA